MTTQSKILDLLKLVGDEQKFRQAIAYYEAITPKPYKHFESQSFTPSSCDRTYCIKCHKHLDTVADIKSDCLVPDPYTGSLGDLAFELRDKVGYGLFLKGITKVHNMNVDISVGQEPDTATVSAKEFLLQAKPEHWIIAALYALELAKEKK
jgi:hypothetical protein